MQESRKNTFVKMGLQLHRREKPIFCLAGTWKLTLCDVIKTVRISPRWVTTSPARCLFCQAGNFQQRTTSNREATQSFIVTGSKQRVKCVFWGLILLLITWLSQGCKELTDYCILCTLFYLHKTINKLCKLIIILVPFDSRHSLRSKKPFITNDD